MAGQIHSGASRQLRLLRSRSVQASMTQQDALDAEKARLDKKEAQLDAEKARLNAKEKALPPGDSADKAALLADKEALAADKKALAADKETLGRERAALLDRMQGESYLVLAGVSLPTQQQQANTQVLACLSGTPACP